MHFFMYVIFQWMIRFFYYNIFHGFAEIMGVQYSLQGRGQIIVSLVLQNRRIIYYLLTVLLSVGRPWCRGEVRVGNDGRVSACHRDIFETLLDSFTQIVGRTEDFLRKYIDHLMIRHLALAVTTVAKDADGGPGQRVMSLLLRVYHEDHGAHDEYTRRRDRAPNNGDGWRGSGATFSVR